MHYKNGREAKVGDQIIGKDSSGQSVAGTLVKTTAGSTTCNGQIVPFNSPTWTVTLGECLHADDVTAKPAEEPAPAT